MTNPLTRKNSPTPNGPKLIQDCVTASEIHSTGACTCGAATVADTTPCANG